MRDPRPVLWLFIAQALGLLALVGWWLGLPAPERLARLAQYSKQSKRRPRPQPRSSPRRPGW